MPAAGACGLPPAASTCCFQHSPRPLLPARIELDHQPSQWRLSPALAGALGIKGHHSGPFVMQMLWGYIKAKQLYEVGAWGA